LDGCGLDDILLAGVAGGDLECVAFDRDDEGGETRGSRRCFSAASIPAAVQHLVHVAVLPALHVALEAADDLDRALARVH
jgi:hypothetical protein